MPLTDSWYMGANIPGKPREQLNYLGGVEEYEVECHKALENLEGFTVVHEVETRCNGDRGQVYRIGKDHRDRCHYFRTFVTGKDEDWQ